MAGWRDNKRAMRRVVHETMEVPALYLTHVGATPLAVNVRDHTKFKEVQISGAGPGFADMQDTTPRFIFRRSEVATPLHKAFVIMGEDEMYTLGSSRPPDDEFITVEAAPLSAGQRAEIWDTNWAALL